MTHAYASAAEIESILRGFEDCATDKDHFKHRDHLTVATCYLESHPFTTALDKMREGLFRFLKHHGVDKGKYHETLTVFWMKQVADHLRKMPSEASLAEKVNAVVAALDDKALVFEYYSHGLLETEEARTRFVAPDLKG